MSTNIYQTTNGAHVNGAPLTTAITESAAPGLLRNSVDERIVKIRPMATPVDQLSRCAGARSCNSMKVNYYAVDVKPINADITASLTAADAVIEDDAATLYVPTTRDAIFSVSETLLLPGVTVSWRDNGVATSGPLMLYVISIDNTKGLLCRLVNVNITDNSGVKSVDIPEIKDGTKIVRMGRAAAELDVQTAQFEALPKRRGNNCQIFKMQIEQSTFQKLANKEVGWNFSDQEEVAVIDMRQGMEKNFLFGQRAEIFDPVKKETVYLTGGIWGQTTRQYTYTPGKLTRPVLTEMCRKAFTGSGSGSNRKILIAGSGLIRELSNMEYDKVLSAGQTYTRWGIEFREIVSNFGTLYVVHSEIFDQCEHTYDGFILDPDYMTKYCHVPFHAETLDLRRSGLRNSDAIVLTEASCLVLRHPNTHMRVVANLTV